MSPVRITRVGVAHPRARIGQQEAAKAIGVLGGNLRRAMLIARGSSIQERAIAVPVAEIGALGDIEARNREYQQIAGPLALEAFEAVARPDARDRVGSIVTSSCTGYGIPGWGSQLVGWLGLRCDTTRLPITEAGCAGGVVALARAADFIAGHPGRSALAGAAEICSLSFHPGGDDGNLISTLIFGDGAGAALIEDGPGPGLEILDSASMLIPGTRDALGFDLTGRGFYPVLSRRLATLLAPATRAAVVTLLRRNGLDCHRIGAWLMHPGGARILAGLEAQLAVRRARNQWAWDSMRDFGNTSSAAIFDVLRRYLDEPRPDGELGVVAAFGPGVAIELLLVRRVC